MLQREVAVETLIKICLLDYESRFNNVEVVDGQFIITLEKEDKNNDLWLCEGVSKGQQKMETVGSSGKSVEGTWC